MSSVAWLRDDARPAELTARMVEFFDHYASVVGLTADRIGAEARSRETKRRALEWKIQAVAVGQRAALRLDPLGALFDSWTLCAQMRAYLTTGPGRDLFAEGQPLAIEAAADLEERIEAIARTVVKAPDLSPLRQMVDEGVERYPITGPLYTRASPITDYAQLVADAAAGLMGTAADLNRSVTNIAKRLTILSEQVPLQAQWQAELLLSDDLHATADAFARIADTVERAPELVAEEREAAVQLIREERGVLLEAAHEHRSAVLDALVNERLAIVELLAAEREKVLAAVDGQRRETIEALRQERVAVVEALRQERVAVIEAVQREREVAVGAIGEAMDASFPRMRNLIDHFFLRALQLVGVVAAGALVFALVRRRSGAPGPSAR